MKKATLGLAAALCFLFCGCAQMRTNTDYQMDDGAWHAWKDFGEVGKAVDALDSWVQKYFW